MDFDSLATFISNYGFPIVSCAALFWYVNKTQKELIEKIDESIRSLNSSINAMNTTVAKLITVASIPFNIGGDSDG